LASVPLSISSSATNTATRAAKLLAIAAMGSASSE
jgi:hypothetical protein